jgi:hypothetical protein
VSIAFFKLPSLVPSDRATAANRRAKFDPSDDRVPRCIGKRTGPNFESQRASSIGYSLGADPTAGRFTGVTSKENMINSHGVEMSPGPQ